VSDVLLFLAVIGSCLVCTIWWARARVRRLERDRVREAVRREEYRRCAEVDQQRLAATDACTVHASDEAELIVMAAWYRMITEGMEDA
jgi:hypothetical protein